MNRVRDNLTLELQSTNGRDQAARFGTQDVRNAVRKCKKMEGQELPSGKKQDRCQEDSGVGCFVDYSRIKYLDCVGKCLRCHSHYALLTLL